ncbi:MAG: cyanophycin synthetase, partial [Thermodesulfobacteriota bacterium]
LAGRDFTVTGESEGGFHYKDSSRNITGLKVALPGAHQMENSALALRALMILTESGFTCTDEELRRGLTNVSWPGRCELVRESPKVVLDCAHNESAAKALASTLDEFPRSRLILVIGIMKDKDFRAILAHLAPLADKIIFTRADMERSEAPEKLMESLREFSTIEAEVIPTVAMALEGALEEAASGDLVCVTGSVFIVGEAKAVINLNAQEL